jgi:hypothetical protein
VVLELITHLLAMQFDECHIWQKKGLQAFSVSGVTVFVPFSDWSLYPECPLQNHCRNLSLPLFQKSFKACPSRTNLVGCACTRKVPFLTDSDAQMADAQMLAESSIIQKQRYRFPITVLKKSTSYLMHFLS